MNEKTTKIVAGVALAVAVIAGFLAITAQLRQASASQNIVGAVADLSSKVDELGKSFGLLGKTVETYGASQADETDWTAGHFTDDLDVDDALNVDGNTTLVGNATVGGTLDVTGAVTGAYIDSLARASIVSVTTTQSLAQLTNSSSNARILKGAGCIFGSSVSGEVERPTISTAFTTTVTTGTGATLLYDNPITMSTVSSTITATSSLMTTQQVWHRGQTIQFNIASPTTTLTGTCYASYSR